MITKDDCRYYFKMDDIGALVQQDSVAPAIVLYPRVTDNGHGSPAGITGTFAGSFTSTRNLSTRSSPPQLEFGATDSWSFSCWVLVSAQATANRIDIAYKGREGESGRLEYRISLSKDGSNYKVEVAIDDGTTTATLLSTHTLSGTGTWNHLAVTNDNGGNELAIWINGSSNKTSTTHKACHVAKGALYVASDDAGNNGDTISIDALAFYSDAIKVSGSIASAVDDLYNSGNGQELADIHADITPDVICWFEFEMHGALPQPDVFQQLYAESPMVSPITYAVEGVIGPSARGYDLSTSYQLVLSTEDRTNLSPSGNTTFTLAMWLYAPSNLNYYGTKQTILEHGVGSIRDFGYDVVLEDTGKLRIRTFNGSGFITGLRTQAAIPYDQWFQVAFVFGAPADLIYIDGAAVSVEGAETDTTWPDDARLRIFGDTFTSFEGYIDELVLFDKRLSSDEVSCQLWNAGRGTTYPKFHNDPRMGLVAYFPADDEPGPKVRGVALKVGDGSDPTIQVPCDFDVGDLFVAIVTAKNTFSASPPSGWTVEQTEFNSGTAIYMMVLSRQAQEGDDTFAFSATVDDWTATCIRISGHDHNTPIHKQSTHTGTSDPFAVPQVTTTVNDCLLISGAALDGIASSTPPTGTREITNHLGGNQAVRHRFAFDYQATAGATGSRSFGNTDEGQGCGILLAIAPDPVSGGTGDRIDFVNEHLLQEVGSVPVATGKLHKAIDFPGTAGNYLKALNDNHLQMAQTGWTLAFWIYVDEYADSTVYTVAHVAHQWSIEINNSSLDRVLDFLIEDQVVIGPNTALASGTWHHIAFVHDPYNRRNVARYACYLNGTRTETTFTNRKIGTYASSDLYLGTEENDTPTNARLNGRIDELAFWNRPLDQEELAWFTAPVAYPFSALTAPNDLEVATVDLAGLTGSFTLTETIGAGDTELGGLSQQESLQAMVAVADTLTPAVAQVGSIQDAVNIADVFDITGGTASDSWSARILVTDNFSFTLPPCDVILEAISLAKPGIRNESIAKPSMAATSLGKPSMDWTRC